MKLLVLPRYDRRGASSRQRLLQFVPDLARLGWEITVRPLHRPAYLEALYAGRRRSPLAVATDYTRRLGVLGDAGRHDLIWVERELLPWLPWGLERRWVPRPPLVVDYDDAVFHRYDRHKLALVRRLLGDKIDRVMRQAALVVAGNDYLAERARSAGAGRVAVVPTVIDPALYPAADAAGSGAPARPFVIGWIGTPATVGYLRLVGPALAALAAESPVRLVTIGASIELPGVPGEARPWSEATEAVELARCHVGIMPLPDGPWERGKCGYKLVQYMASGLPVVASPVGANRKIVDPGITGCFAEGEERWLTALRVLRDDPDLRLRLGAAGRARALAHYSRPAVLPRLAELLAAAVSSRSASAS
jgi:glycosyltransferase involved in cell wall biosynthesis